MKKPPSPREVARRRRDGRSKLPQPRKLGSSLKEGAKEKSLPLTREVASPKGLTEGETSLHIPSRIWSAPPWVQTIGEHLMQMQMFSYGLKSHEKRKK